MASLASVVVGSVGTTDTKLASPYNYGQLKLTGIVIKPDPRSSYKPSRVIILLVDGAERTAIFRSRVSQSTLMWDVTPVALITPKSTISIQPFEARSFIQRTRKREEKVVIQGDAVFRFCSNRSADKHEYERVCKHFRVILSVAVQKVQDKKRSDPRGYESAADAAMAGLELHYGPHTAPNQFKTSLSRLTDLMKSLPPDSPIYEAMRSTKASLGHACEWMPTEHVEDDIQRLGEQACAVLTCLQESKVPECLDSQESTVRAMIHLVGNAAMFAEDCSKLEFRDDLRNPDSRKDILEDFEWRFAKVKKNFDVGKDVAEAGEPYIRKALDTSTPVPFPSAVEDESEVSDEEPEPETQTIASDEDHQLTEWLKPYFVPGEYLHLSCLDGTRVPQLSKITAWLEDDEAHNVLWLTGAAGTGKTSIAWSLVPELARQQRCAGEFFLRPGQHYPSALWQTLAYKIASFHPAIKSEIFRALATEGSLRDSIHDTFEALVLSPLKAAEPHFTRLGGPVLLIDGLDHCKQGSRDDWLALLSTLPRWLSLSHRCKLIITSRHDIDISRAFEGKEIERMELRTGDADDNNTVSDIHRYLTYRFAELRKQDREKSIQEDWPAFDTVYKLAEHASGFFRWAALAFDSIRAADSDRERHLTSIVDGGPGAKFDGLDEYLGGILALVCERGSFRTESFQAILETVTLSSVPLTIHDLKHFLQDRLPGTASVDSLESMCHELLAVISIDEETKAITLRHQAYKSYLTDQKRCTVMDGASMTVSCLKIMQQELKFNTCGLKSSSQFNRDIENKDALVKSCIPPHLSYACRFWADHLHGTVTMEKRDTDIVNLLRGFLIVNIPHWLEALSLLGHSRAAAKSLLVAAEWLEATDKDMSSLAADGSRFALTFADVIAASAPHIYISALPFTPRSSLIYKRYHAQYPRIFGVLREKEDQWPAMRFSISADYAVHSISVHPDGRRLAVGSSSTFVASVTTGETLFHLNSQGYTVRTVAYSPNGKRISIGSDDGRLRIFESENGALLFGPFDIHSDWIRSAAWSPDGQRIVTGSDDRTVKITAVESGQIVYDTSLHSDWVRTVIYTPEFFASGSDDRRVRIYDASTGTASGEAWVTGQTGYIKAIAVSPDYKILAAGSDDTTIVLYDVETRSVIGQPLRGHTGAIRSLTFSKDGLLLASGSDDTTVRLWDVQTGKRFCDPLYGHTDEVSSVRFSPDMKQLIAGGEDRAVRFFDMSSLPVFKDSVLGTGPFRAAISLGDDGDTILSCDNLSLWKWGLKERNVENTPFQEHVDHLSGIQSASISPDGTLVATAARDRMVFIWQSDTGTALWGPMEGHSDDIFALSFSADGKMVASGSDDRTLRVWSAETGTCICGPLTGHSASVRGICFSPDGKLVASGSNDNTAIIWSIENGDMLHKPLEYHRDWIYGLAFSPNERYLATGSDDYTVAIWDMETGERVFHPLTGHDGYLRVVNWSPDSKRIVTGGRDYLIRVFDAETGTLLFEPLTGHRDAVTAVAFRPTLRDDDPEVISASMDGTVRVWRLKVRSLKKIRTISDNHNDWVRTIALSPTDNCVASGDDDGKLVVVNATTGDPKFSCAAHRHWICCVSYSPDGTKIATCSEDRTISVWDAESGERYIGPLRGHTGAVLSIEFSPRGGFLISGSADTTACRWDLHPTFSMLNNPMETYRGHQGAVNSVTYAHGDSLVVTGSADAHIAVWEGRASEQQLWRVRGHQAAVLSVRVSDERIFSSSEDKTIRVWRLSDGQSLRTIDQGHTAPINAIALSSDGRRILSASDDASLRVLDSESGEPCAFPRLMSDRVLSVAVSLDGTLVACSGRDKSVHVWRANIARRALWPQDFIERVGKLEFCSVDEQGELADFATLDDGWIRGSNGELMCWVPTTYRPGLRTPRTVGVLGAIETMLNFRNFVYGTSWEKCRFVSPPGKG
ncbi:WD40-repeat-containing domain protein [Gloeopeniophorella convolvens]|nr:WD40-repeat-containing domain protein [Gloeopeniophorella convolvens]